MAFRTGNPRGWRLPALLAAIAVGAVGAFLVVSRHSGAPSPAASERSGRAVVRPGAVFSQAPYMGVACPVANSIACDRVGLAVWLRRPAIAVTAIIAGAPVALDWHGDLPPASSPSRPRRAFDGYLQPAGIVTRLHVASQDGGRRWFGDGAPSPVVRFRIEYGGGRAVVTREHVMLAAGWG